MESESLSQRTAQLDKAEREQLEDVVEDLRERVEDNVRFQLTQAGVDEEPEDRDALDDETEQLVDAIELEGVDEHGWDEAFEKYVTGVGYTIVNRLAALRCMEVRGFVDEEVTVFKDNGLTPAAETLVYEEFLLEDEAILQAYHNTCDDLAEEIEILFDRESAYSLVDPDDDTFEELCEMLDEVPDEVWRADDVLGWVYEYYNRPVVEALDAKNTLEPDDVGPANQFYTPHWVVRMLADNSLGKLYLEATGQESTVPEPEALSPEERKERLVTPEESPTVAELCTYLIPDDDEQEAPEFDHPSELRVIDPACGSGHFLLYAFDILERIWWAETDLPRSEIPAKILEHNLYGVDIDLRSCQLSAFNLYLKARTRAEAEDGSFEMPNVGIVCADARVAEVEEAVDVLDEIAGEGTDVRAALDGIIEEFQTTEALGSLLDVQGTLSEEFMQEQSDVMEWSSEGVHTLNGFLRELRAAVDERASDSFSEQNLRSFLNLLVVLTQDYDVALMNPPYGSGGRMPNPVQDYVDDNYEYTTEYYINFFEACDRLAKTKGRVGMLVPRTFMFKRTFKQFRTDFIEKKGSFDFLAEYGIGILDNATVRTVGTVVRSGEADAKKGTFIRLEDGESKEKEKLFLKEVLTGKESEIQRIYNVETSEFTKIPWKPLSYYTSSELRSLHESELKLDPDASKISGRNVGTVAQGIISGNNPRFVRKHWEVSKNSSFAPLAKGGSDAWIQPRVTHKILFDSFGKEIKRAGNSRFQNTQYYFQEGVTWTNIKETGRRFGHHSERGIFDQKSPTLFPDEHLPLELIAVLNSSLYHGLMLSMTPDREWNPGDVGRLPWDTRLDSDEVIKNAIEQQFAITRYSRSFDPTSPYYIGPKLLPERSQYDFFHSHPYTQEGPSQILESKEQDFTKEQKIPEIARQAEQNELTRLRTLEELSDKVDNRIYNILDISAKTQEEIRREIFLRTSESPEDREIPDADSIPSPPNNLKNQVKDLVHHLVLKVNERKKDGIVPISRVDDEPDLLSRLEAEFERIWGEHATDRLAEVDQLLGSQTADEEAYPNLREWLAEDLFEYHVSKFDRTPILWRFTTERLVSDPAGEGFACLVDYHQLDAGVFDRLQNRYLEPRKALLREQRSAANRRRSDDSLSTSEQANAAAEYNRCESGLEQIAVFEDRLADLAQPEPREWPSENRELAADAAELVAEFRQQVADRLSKLEALAAMEDVDMAEVFTPTFYSTVEENREEWVDALEDLEAAFDAYATDGSEPVEAHLYDLFEYYDDLVGSAHYASNGILFMNYYFKKFDDADQAKIGDGGVSERQRLLSELASDLDAYEALAEEIAEACDEIASGVDSEWKTRALSEITTAGYRPNRKHGVDINITPLAEAEIVPKTVDDKVL
jgi:hypothetical protein